MWLLSLQINSIFEIDIKTTPFHLAKTVLSKLLQWFPEQPTMKKKRQATMKSKATLEEKPLTI